jgi:predicted RNase H-like HicB family nuclease
MSHYLAALEPDGHGGFGVFFPDLPGLASAGDSQDEAIAEAVQALAGHVAAMRDDGDVIPRPRSLDALRHDRKAWADIKGLILVAIPLLDVGGQSVRVNISATRREIEAIDEAARRRGLTRSAFLIEAARDKISTEAG